MSDFTYFMLAMVFSFFEKVAFVFRYSVLFGVFLIMGCDVDNSDARTVHSYTVEHYDEVTGLTLMPSDNMYITFSEMVILYDEVQACMGMTAPGPTVYFKNFLEYFGWIGGFGFHTQGTIFINTYTDEATGRYRDLSIDTETLRHEYIHNILYHNTGSGDPTHSSGFYEICGLGPALHN